MKKISLSQKLRLYFHYKFYKYSSKKNRGRICKVLCCIIRHPFYFTRMIVGDLIYIPYVEVVVTRKCTLKCRDCSNLIQYYSSPKEIRIDDIITPLNMLFTIVDSIGMVNILGGEPLLYRNLTDLVRFLLEKKVDNIQITTNGTIIPKDRELFDVCKNSRVSFFISNYGKLSRQYGNIKMLFENEGITTVSTDKEWKWIDQGGIECRNRSKEELSEQFKRCNHDCKSILNGELHYCPRSSHGKDLGFVKPNRNDYLDLLTTNKKEIKRFLNTEIDYIEACNYCDDGLKRVKVIDPAIQCKTTIEQSYKR